MPSRTHTERPNALRGKATDGCSPSWPCAHATKSARWFGDWGSPEFDVHGGGAVIQGALEVLLGVVLLGGSALDYFGILSFKPVMNVVKTFLEF